MIETNELLLFPYQLLLSKIEVLSPKFALDHIFVVLINYIKNQLV